MLPTTLKKNRRNISEGESLSVDIISNLHDSVLSHILSFLPSTKEAVTTSILSKRWRYVWTSVDKLHFVNWKRYGSAFVRDRMLFPKYVSNVFKLLHQGNIKELALYCDSRCHECDVTRWIDTAISLGVEILNVTTGFDFRFPLSMSTCKTLIDLQLDDLGSLIGTISSMNNPTSPIFPCLKKLNVPFLGCDSKSFQGIVSQCSALEHLIVDDIRYTIDIVSSSMKRLELHFSPHDHFDQKIFLGVPNLEYLQIYCILPLKIIENEQLSSLIEARICFRDSPYAPDVDVKKFRDSFVRFIQPLSNVKLLRLELNFQRYLNSVGHGWFPNLTKLDIVSRFFEWRLLVSLMDISINLESISLKKTSTLKKHKLYWREPKRVSACLSSSLRRISIDGYGFSEYELPMVKYALKYILRTAQILERMDIWMDLSCANNMIRKMQKLPRACERCEISLMKKL